MSFIASAQTSSTPWSVIGRVIEAFEEKDFAAFSESDSAQEIVPQVFKVTTVEWDHGYSIYCITNYKNTAGQVEEGTFNFKIKPDSLSETHLFSVGNWSVTEIGLHLLSAGFDVMLCDLEDNIWYAKLTYWSNDQPKPGGQLRLMKK